MATFPDVQGIALKKERENQNTEEPKWALIDRKNESKHHTHKRNPRKTSSDQRAGHHPLRALWLSICNPSKPHNPKIRNLAKDWGLRLLRPVYCVCVRMLYPPRIAITVKLTLIFFVGLNLANTTARSPSCFIENVWHWLDTHIQQQVSQLRTLDHARAILPAYGFGMIWQRQHLDAPLLLHDCTRLFIGSSFYMKCKRLTLQ